MDMNHKYTEQQAALDEIAARLGIVCCRLDGEKQPDEKHTVWFYTKEDDDFNQQSMAKPPKFVWTADGGHNERIFKPAFWSFENSDKTGSVSMDWANSGTIDLCADRWKETLEGHIRLALAQKRQNDHIYATGGFHALREADEIYNNQNRKMIEAMLQIHGSLYLGEVNYFGEQRKRVAAGESIYEPYTGQLVYNFGCDFCVPTADDALQELIRRWNASDKLPKKAVEVNEIMQRIEQIGGRNFIWF